VATGHDRGHSNPHLMIIHYHLPIQPKYFTTYIKQLLPQIITNFDVLAAVDWCEFTISLYQSARRYNPEDSKLHTNTQFFKSIAWFKSYQTHKKQESQ
jgi:hypothetical protein